MDVAPKCPRCGSRMVLRTARQGPNAGNRFWGCSRYPACKGTVEASEPQSESVGGASTGSVSPRLPPLGRRVFPVEVQAGPRRSGQQCCFFQTCALPAAIVETLHMADADRAAVRAAVQWRLDFPMPRDAAAAEPYLSILAVAESLLTRGSTPLCFPGLEQALGPEVAASQDENGLLDALRRVALDPTARLQPLSFQSSEERMVFELVSGWVEEDQLGWSLIPQIGLASLTDALLCAGGERGDLLLAHADPHRLPILVEVDGAHHQSHHERDRDRDRAVESAGVRVLRIPAAEARQGKGPTLDGLRQLVQEARCAFSAETELTRAIRWYKFIHQMQLALLVALRGGWLRTDEAWAIAVLPPTILQKDPRVATLLPLAVSDLVELLARLARVHGQTFSPPGAQVIIVDGEMRKNPPGALHRAGILIAPADGGADALPISADARFEISDVCFPRQIRVPPVAVSPLRSSGPPRDDVLWFLRYLFRKQDFWEGQWETIRRGLEGLDSVVLLPTGGGKSIAFQLAALLLPGRCIVVDPIISLIEDQMDNLRAVGIDRCIGITSELSTEERELALKAFSSGHYLFCYVAPERFQIKSFRDALRTLTTHTPVSLIAIDEAHCVSEWGHDFRTAYLNLGRITREYCASQTQIPPLMALTGTASRIVLKDVQRELGITDFDAVISPKSFDRPELRYRVVRCRSDEKHERTLGLLQALPTRFGIAPQRFFQPAGLQTYAGLVFCPHVGGPYGVVEVAERLKQDIGAALGVYSGQAPRNVAGGEWEAEKRRVAHDFKRNRITLMACTKAFGMGIDKPNIRYTVHTGLPPSIEGFYQEAGRAGRDRRPAYCTIVLSNDDLKRSQELLSPATPLERVAARVEQTPWDDADDVVRALWFHVRAFRGVAQEVEDIERMLDQLGEISQAREVNVSWRDPRWASEDNPDRGGRERAEKALHRLVVLGVVADYTVNFASEEFAVRIAGATPEEIADAIGRYAGAYQSRLGEQMRWEALRISANPYRKYVLAVAKRLIHFIYQHVELARRRALSEMLDAAMSARDGEELRRRILNYLEQSEWDELLERVRTSKRGGMDQLAQILEMVVSPNDASALRAAAGRALASYPDVPGFLTLRSVAEAMCPDADPEVVRQNAEAALKFAKAFALDPSDVASGWGSAVTRAATKPGAAELLLHAIVRTQYADRQLLRALLPHLPRPLVGEPSWLLLGKLRKTCAELLTETQER